MVAILAIDAAWTPSQPSGVALLDHQGSVWRCIAIAPSYDQFIRECYGEPVNWGDTPRGNMPDVDALLDSSKKKLRGKEVDLVTVDMPVSKLSITKRRPADQAVSREFGAQGCGTHSPNAIRPGELGAKLTRGFARRGYPVATTDTSVNSPTHLLEVYPHPALLRLLDASNRLPYKVSKSTKYWPNTTIEDRLGRLLVEFARIHNKLSQFMNGIELGIPGPSKVRQLSHLKRYEDAIDALICGWVGICYLAGSAVPFGDEHAAIWIPDKHWSR